MGPCGVNLPCTTPHRQKTNEAEFPGNGRFLLTLSITRMNLTLVGVRSFFYGVPTRSHLGPVPLDGTRTWNT